MKTKTRRKQYPPEAMAQILVLYKTRVSVKGIAIVTCVPEHRVRQHIAESGIKRIRTIIADTSLIREADAASARDRALWDLASRNTNEARRIEARATLRRLGPPPWWHDRGGISCTARLCAEF